MPKSTSAPVSYKDAGVDPSTDDGVLTHLQRLRARTFGPRVLATDGPRASMLRLDFHEKLFAKNYREPVLLTATNGVGTKLKIAAMVQSYDTVGRDVVALAANDLIAQGAEPLLFSPYLATGETNPGLVMQVTQGMSDACADAGMALLPGDTSQLPGALGPHELDLAGFAVGVVEKSRLFDLEEVEPGDVVLGLSGNGLHANGFSLVRRIVFDKLHLSAQTAIPELHGPLGAELLKPTRLYVRPIRELLARYKSKRVIKAMTPVTTGGLAGRLPMLLPSRLGIRLKRDSLAPVPIFQWLESAGPVDAHEMLRVFNMGIGFAMIVRPTFAKPLITHLRTLGERPIALGKVKKSAGMEWN